jgi:hypothetical protein
MQAGFGGTLMRLILPSTTNGLFVFRVHCHTELPSKANFECYGVQKLSNLKIASNVKAQENNFSMLY